MSTCISVSLRRALILEEKKLRPIRIHLHERNFLSHFQIFLINREILHSNNLMIEVWCTYLDDWISKFF